MAPNGDAPMFGSGTPTAAAPHRSIGEVLALLKDEFPDITISKIRFLESQGLLDPERTPSGYRRFYDKDVERLRWILRQQRENFLPLKVIKGRLAEGADVEVEPAPAQPAHAPKSPVLDIREAHAADARPAAAEQPTAAPRVAAEPARPKAPEAVSPPAPSPAPSASAPPAPVASAPASASAPAAPAPPVAAEPVRREPPVESGAPASPAASTGAPLDDTPAADPAARRVLPEPALFHRSLAPEQSAYSRHLGDTSVSLTAEELSAATGLSLVDIAELERFDLIEHRPLGPTAVYDDEALLIARAAAQLRVHGVEPRHLRMYKIAADREAGVYEQVVLPILRQRDAEARRRANDTVEELARLGEGLHAAMLRRALKHLS